MLFQLRLFHSDNLQKENSEVYHFHQILIPDSSAYFLSYKFHPTSLSGLSIRQVN